MPPRKAPPPKCPVDALGPDDPDAFVRPTPKSSSITSQTPLAIPSYQERIAAWQREHPLEPVEVGLCIRLRGGTGTYEERLEQYRRYREQGFSFFETEYYMLEDEYRKYEYLHAFSPSSTDDEMPEATHPTNPSLEPENRHQMSESFARQYGLTEEDRPEWAKEYDRPYDPNHPYAPYSQAPGCSNDQPLPQLTRAGERGMESFRHMTKSLSERDNDE